MERKSNFEIGREYYLKQEYEQAAKWFMLGIEGSSACMGWLGHCYEYGLGVSKNLPLAKDLYIGSYYYLSNVQRSEKFDLWVNERLANLENIQPPIRESRHLPGLGNVRVVKSKYTYFDTKVRYNKDETVVEIDKRDPILFYTKDA